MEGAAFVEICSSDGKVARVVMSDGDVVKYLVPGDKAFEDYIEVMGLERAAVMRLK